MVGKWKSYSMNFIAIILLYGLLFYLIESGFINSYYEGILFSIGINIILAVSLNLTTGFLGQLVLGHAGFVAIGAYAAALTTMHMNLSDSLQLIVSLLIGGVFAGISGMIIGIPALRLRGDYLGIITLGFGEMIRVFIFNMEFTGGAKGLKGIMPLSNFHSVFWITVLVIAVTSALIHSRHGRAILSIREDEIAAEAVGIPITRYKVMAFSLAAFFAGIGGGLFAHYMTVLDPRKYNFVFSIDILVMVVLGGMGSITGSILAAIVLTVIPELFRGLAEYRILLNAILLIIVMLFRPEGLLGRREFSLGELFENSLKEKGEK